MSERNLQNPRSGRRQYLITYSQADINKFPTRESFGKMYICIIHVPCTSYQRVTNELPTSYPTNQYTFHYSITSYHELPLKLKKYMF